MRDHEPAAYDCQCVVCNDPMLDPEDLKVLWSADDWGDECPICGDPFEVRSSGYIGITEGTSTDVKSWVRVCVSNEHPEGFTSKVIIEDDVTGNEIVPDPPFCYVHKDGNYEVNEEFTAPVNR